MDMLLIGIGVCSVIGLFGSLVLLVALGEAEDAEWRNSRS